MSLYKKSSYLEQNSYLHSQIYDFNPKYLKKEREKNLKFPQEWHKDESIEILSPVIHLKRWVSHFNREYIIKLSIKDLIPYQLNLTV